MSAPLPRRLRSGCFALLVALAACHGDDTTTPPPSAGALVATLQSPAAAEGAAVFELPDGRVQGVAPPPGGVAWVVRDGGRARVVVVLGTPGAVTFTLLTDDVGAPPDATVVQVSGPDDAARLDLSGYAVTFAEPTP